MLQRTCSHKFICAGRSGFDFDYSDSARSFSNLQQQSAVYKLSSVIIVCRSAIGFDHSATEPDGDVIVYELVQPWLEEQVLHRLQILHHHRHILRLSGEADILKQLLLDLIQSASIQPPDC